MNVTPALTPALSPEEPRMRSGQEGERAGDLGKAVRNGCMPRLSASSLPSFASVRCFTKPNLFL